MIEFHVWIVDFENTFIHIKLRKNTNLPPPSKLSLEV